MPKKGITGHDGWVMTEALATALIALEQLPPKHNRTPKWTISGSFWLPVASLVPSTCISPRQSAGCFPIWIERPSMENTASRTDKPEETPTAVAHDQADRNARDHALSMGASG